MIHDLNDYNVYACKDNRTRAYNKKTKTIVSYPKILMENILGRILAPDEDVHHKDGNPLNNNPWNLIVINKAEHDRLHMQQDKISEKQKKYFGRKYFDKEMICPVCGNKFIWTARVQSSSKRNKTNAQPCCSRKCRAILQNRSNITIETIQKTIVNCKGNFIEASKILGISDSAIHKRLRKAGLLYKSKDYK